MNYETVISCTATPTAHTSDVGLAIVVTYADCCAGCVQCLGQRPINALQIVSSSAAERADGCQYGVTVESDDLRTC